MALKVTVDEDLPRQAVQLLREHGYDAASVVEQGMSGWKDAQLWLAVQSPARWQVASVRADECAFTGPGSRRTPAGWCETRASKRGV